MNACVLTIGDELLQGFTNDTNSSWLGIALLPYGINISKKITIGDDINSIIQESQKILDDNLLLNLSMTTLFEKIFNIDLSYLPKYFISKKINIKPKLQHRKIKSMKKEKRSSKTYKVKLTGNKKALLDRCKKYSIKCEKKHTLKKIKQLIRDFNKNSLARD